MAAFGAKAASISVEGIKSWDPVVICFQKVIIVQQQGKRPEWAIH
jgi:hypothetical protein